MATVYSLFLGLLLIAVCSTVGIGDGVVIQKIVIARNVVTQQSDFLDFWIIDQGTRMGADARKAELLNRVQHDGNIGRLVRISPVETSIHGVYHADIPIVETQCIASLRQKIIRIASAELGVRETTGNNDGPRVEEYLRYTDLGKGHAWCAAFVSWCYGQAGLNQPRNPWSPALFPKAKTYWKNGVVLSNKQILNRVQGDGNIGRLVRISPVETSIHGVYHADIPIVETQCIASLRQKIIRIASAELGVRETTGNNDGPRVEEYLRYTGLGKGHAWCAAFVSWCYGQAGLNQPRNPWSPALFPKAKTYWKNGVLLSNKQTLNRVQGDGGKGRQVQVNPADIFGIYGKAAGRINHVGLVKETQGNYLITIEGNSNNKVESRRRHLYTVYALADWVSNQ